MKVTTAHTYLSAPRANEIDRTIEKDKTRIKKWNIIRKKYS